MILQSTNEPDQSQDAIASHREKNPSPLLTINELGPKLWEEIHTKEDPTKEWLLGDWLPRVPNYCACREKASDLIQRYPPDFGPGWFRWTVDFHNRVRASLQQQTFTYSEAESRWGRSINQPKPECDQCGLCCRELSIQFTEADRQREPRLPVLMPEKGCPMISEDNRCTCYETRPDLCRRFEAGNWICNMLRSGAGLEPL